MPKVTKKDERPAGKLPPGWRLRDDLSLRDLERYFAYYNENQGSGSSWELYGASLRAAVYAGWLEEPAGLTAEAIGDLSPKQVPQAFNAVMRHYEKVTEDDPNSSGPSPIT